jgi:hypothetical protein
MLSVNRPCDQMTYLFIFPFKYKLTYTLNYYIHNINNIYLQKVQHLI